MYEQQQTPAAVLAQSIMAGLKPVLLGAGQELQLLACQILATVAMQSPAQLLQQLMLQEACELLFEVVRGTLGSCNMTAQLLASAAVWNGTVAQVAENDQQEAVQVAALTCLQCLVKQGGLFVHSSMASLQYLLCRFLIHLLHHGC
jgi:antitoxin component of MazEF toxin-antitoxin module